MGAPAAQTVLRAVPATPSLPADRLERIAQGQAAPAWPSVPADRLEAPHASVYPSDLAEGVTPHPRAISRCIAQLTAQWAAAPEAAAAFCAGERVRLLN